MNKRPSIQSFKSFALLTFLAPLLLISSENPSHVPVASREMSSGAQEQFQNQIEEQKEESEAEPLKNEVRCGFVFDRYPSMNYSSTVHWLAGASAQGDALEIEDGSVWKISSYDSYKILSWRMDDPILITQNTRWFSSYNYKIVNRATGTSIEANLFLGPLEFGLFTKYVEFIDWTMGDVVLSDGTHYQISNYDSSLLRDWEAGDAVIVGYNSGWDSNCESILINVNMNHFIRGKQF